MRSTLLIIAVLAVLSLSQGSEWTAQADDANVAGMGLRVYEDLGKSDLVCDLGALQRQCTIIGTSPFSIDVVASAQPPLGFIVYRARLAFDTSLTFIQQTNFDENSWPACNLAFASETKATGIYQLQCGTGGSTNNSYSGPLMNVHFSCPAGGGQFQVDIIGGSGTTASRYVSNDIPSTYLLKSVNKGGTPVADAVVIDCLADTDEDGMPDVYEKAHACLDQNVADAGLDGDSDGLDNGDEFELGTEPCVDDTDDDGLLDGAEVNGTASPKPALGVFFTDPLDDDTDDDGCEDGAEVGTNPLLGGGRDPTNFWDFYDTWTLNPHIPGSLYRNQFIDVDDIVAVAARFLTSGSATTVADALTPPGPGTGYHASYDRGPFLGPNSWNRAPANGSVVVDDIGAVANQFFHSC